MTGINRKSPFTVNRCRFHVWWPGKVTRASAMVTSGWQPELSNLRDKVQIFSGFDFNYALLNLYRDGQDAMGWHRDNEVELGQHPMVASISLGSEREFHLRAERGAPLHRVRLEHGSLLLMPGKVMHHLPRRKGVSDPRINISLRCVKLNANQNVNHY